MSARCPRVSLFSPGADPLPVRSAFLPGVRRTLGLGARPHPSSGAARPHCLDLQIDGKVFGGTRVLGAVSITLDPGQTLAVTGPSGIGKSTLLRIMAGLDRDYEGRVWRPERLSMVFQEPTLLPWRTARANLTLTTGIDAARADRALDEVGLAGMGDRFPGQLSLGQQRRLALARAFAMDPDLLLMDEPFVSLDTARAEELYALFEALRARRPVATVLVTHDLGEARRLADRIVRLDGLPATLSPAV
ncbi:MAG: ABC transporter ATP-binding protein [Rhodobacteraceae bacterium]|nr:ABC transporter ATP-binding protein [Paracoccaceae bacterium]